MTWTWIDGGSSAACGVALGGAAYCWGASSGGALGAGGLTRSDVPIAVVGGLSFVSISAGDSHHVCGITTARDAYCWGIGREGQLGHGAFDLSLPAPVMVVGGLKWASINAGGAHTCGITTAGDAYCWGDGSRGKRGDSFGGVVNAPSAVAGGLKFVSISAGGVHTCGITTDGDAHCWGSGVFSGGAIGDGTTQDRFTPTLVVGGHKWTAITAGNTHSCGITTAGFTYCWGSNSFGELGNDTNIASTVPVLIADPPSS